MEFWLCGFGQVPDPLWGHVPVIQITHEYCLDPEEVEWEKSPDLQWYLPHALRQGES